MSSHVYASDRAWVVDARSLVSVLFSNQVEPEVGSSYSLDSQEIYLSFGYNFQSYEVGPVLSYYNVSADNESSKLIHYGAYFRYNFVPNSSDAMVPFAKVRLLAGNKIDHFNWALSSGVTFFPLSDLVGIDVALSYRNTKATGDIPGKTSGFALATAFNLYF